MSLFIDSNSLTHDSRVNGTDASGLLKGGNLSLFFLATTAVPGESLVTRNHEPAVDPSSDVLKFVVWGVLGSVLAVLGFLGNTLSIVVLQRRQMRSSTSYYLLSLAIYDNAILLGMLFYFCLPAMAPYTPFLHDYESISSMTIPVGYPLSLAAQMGSIYTCVGFTVERFIAVCRPLHVANTCTKSRTIRAIILIFVWSIVYNIPRFFHYHVHHVDENPPMTNPTPAPHFNQTALYNHSTHAFRNNNTVAFQSMVDFISSSTTPISNTSVIPQVKRVIRYKETAFGSDPTFQHLYLIYSQLFFMFLLPFIIILVMNIGLIRAVKNSKSMHQSMCASARKEHNLTVMLIAVIVVFLVCQFPTIIDNMLVAVFGDAKLKSNSVYMSFYIVCSLMVEINAASNFLLYCFFGKKFRLMLLNILGFKRKKHQVAYRSTVSKSRTNGTRIYEMEVSVM